MVECSRREFLKGAIIAAEAGSAITIAGCTIDNGKKPPVSAQTPSFRESAHTELDMFYIASDVPLQKREGASRLKTSFWQNHPKFL